MQKRIQRLLQTSTNSNPLSHNFFIITLKVKLSPNMCPPLDFDLRADITGCSIKPANNNNHRLAIQDGSHFRNIIQPTSLNLAPTQTQKNPPVNPEKKIMAKTKSRIIYWLLMQSLCSVLLQFKRHQSSNTFLQFSSGVQKELIFLYCRRRNHAAIILWVHI